MVRRRQWEEGKSKGADASQIGGVVDGGVHVCRGPAPSREGKGLSAGAEVRRSRAFPGLAGLNPSSQVKFFPEARWIPSCGPWSFGPHCRWCSLSTPLCFRADGRQQAAVFHVGVVPHSPFPRSVMWGHRKAGWRRRRRLGPALGFRNFRPAVLQPPDSGCSSRPLQLFANLQLVPIWRPTVHGSPFSSEHQPICRSRRPFPTCLSASLTAPCRSNATPERSRPGHANKDRIGRPWRARASRARRISTASWADARRRLEAGSRSARLDAGATVCRVTPLAFRFVCLFPLTPGATLRR